jgi:hypothetical protein
LAYLMKLPMRRLLAPDAVDLTLAPDDREMMPV